MSSMHKINIRFEAKSSLDNELRLKVDRLIFDVWSYEESTFKDVKVLQSNPLLNNPDPLHLHAHHTLAWYGDRLVGYARVNVFQSFKEMVLASPEIPSFISNAGRCAFVSRLVVDPNFRKLGVASRLVEMRIEIARNFGANFVYGCVVGADRQVQVAKSNFQKIHQIDRFQTTWYTTSRSVSLMMLKISDSPLNPTSHLHNAISLPL